MQVNSKRNEKHPELQSNQRVLQASATTVSIGPNAPSNPTAVEASASQVNLAWTVSATPGVTYSVFRGGSSGFAPGSTNLIASGVGATFHADTGIPANVSAAMTYYVVEAVDAAGTSSASNQASVTLPSVCSPACTDVLDINSGAPTNVYGAPKEIGSQLLEPEKGLHSMRRATSISPTPATIRSSRLLNRMVPPGTAADSACGRRFAHQI
jgi:hypothetical protein